jgi:hypothetical protein
MDEPKKPPLSNKLLMPEGISAVGPVMDVQEAYVRSVMAIPEVLQHILATLMEINDSLGIMALYTEKKGLKEEIITAEDLEGGDDDDKGEHTA